MKYVIGLPKKGDKVMINGSGVEGVVLGLLNPEKVGKHQTVNLFTQDPAAVVGIEPQDGKYKNIGPYHPFDLQIKY